MNFVVLFVSVFCLTTPSFGSSSRVVAEKLIDAAPDQFTLHATLLPWDDDLDDKQLLEAEKKRQAIITGLEAKYQQEKATIQGATYLFELGRYHTERANYLQHRAIETYNQDFDRWWIGETLNKPELKLTIVNEQLLAISNKMREFAANFPKDLRTAQVNWMTGSAMARVGNEHIEMYLKLAKQQSKTPEWIRKASLSHADLLMSKKKLDEAIRIYDDVRKEPVQDELKHYATYRLGWAYLIRYLTPEEKQKEDNLKKAMAALQLVVIGMKEDTEVFFQLRKEAINDLTWLWATLDDEAAATAFYEKIGEKKKIVQFKDMQALDWIVKGKLDKAVPYYEAKFKEDPETIERPDIHLRLAHAYIAAGNVAAMQKELDAIIKLTTDTTGDWYDEHHENQAVMTRAVKMHQLLPATVGFRLLSTAQAQPDVKRKKELMTAAILELQKQAAKEKDGTKLLTIRLSIAEALLAQERWKDALNELDSIVTMGAKAGDQLEVAAFERIKILVKLIEEGTFSEVPPPGEVKKPIALPELKARFAVAANDYLRIVPTAENALNLRYQIAHDLFTYGHYTESLPLMEAIANDFPAMDLGKSAIEICVSMNLKFERWDELIRLSTSFLNNRAVKGKALRDFLKQNLEWAKSQKPS